MAVCRLTCPVRIKPSVGSDAWGLIVMIHAKKAVLAVPSRIFVSQTYRIRSEQINPGRPTVCHVSLRYCEEITRHQDRDHERDCFDRDSARKTESSSWRELKTRQQFISEWRLFDHTDEEEIYDGLSLDRRRAFTGCQRVLCYYPLSVAELEDKDLSEALTIFERINQGGKKLNLFRFKAKFALS